jgi:hypothetical protein
LITKAISQPTDPNKSSIESWPLKQIFKNLSKIHKNTGNKAKSMTLSDVSKKWRNSDKEENKSNSWAQI